MTPAARPSVKSKMRLATPAASSETTTRSREQEAVAHAHHALLLRSAEELPVQDDRREPEQRRREGEAHEHEVEHELVVVELGEARLERRRQQEAADDLRAGLHGAHLLQDVAPVAVEAFDAALVAPLAAVVDRGISGHTRCYRRGIRPVMGLMAAGRIAASRRRLATQCQKLRRSEERRP